MRPEDQALLTDILESAREAALYVGDRSGPELEQERMRPLAVVRLLEVIGEAATEKPR